MSTAKTCRFLPVRCSFLCSTVERDQVCVPPFNQCANIKQTVNETENHELMALVRGIESVIHV